MQKSIGMLLDGFYPSDIRVQKEARALIDAGFKVALLCKRRKDEPYYESFEGIELMRIDAGTSHSAKGIIDIIVGLNFVHPIFSNPSRMAQIGSIRKNRQSLSYSCL